jgi:hypothetical protein
MGVCGCIVRNDVRFFCQGTKGSLLDIYCCVNRYDLLELATECSSDTGRFLASKVLLSGECQWRSVCDAFLTPACKGRKSSASQRN